MAIRDADIKLLFGKNVTVGESINKNIANPSQNRRVDKVVDKSEVFRYSIFSTCAI